MEEFYLDSCGAGRLHCALWKPEGEPKAVVQHAVIPPSGWIRYSGHNSAPP